MKKNKMNKFLSFIFILCVVTATDASEYIANVYPDSNQVEVVTTTSFDTVLVTITNISQNSITDFHLTSFDNDSLFVVELLVDGAIVTDFVQESSFGSIYPSQYDCRIAVTNFSQSVTMKIVSANVELMHMTMVGKQPFSFFGVVEPVLANCCVGVRGNVDGDITEQVDISDLVYLVDFMFTEGPSPTCLDEANIDGDIGNGIDISDLVMLVDFMFTQENTSVMLNCP